MKNERIKRGTERLKEVDGNAGQRVIASLEEIAPDLGRYILEFAFEDIYGRDGLSLQEREVITIASLLTAVGISPDKIIETFIQCIPYTGFPKVLNAVNAAKKVFAERNITISKKMIEDIDND